MGFSGSESVSLFPVMSADQIICVIAVDKAWLSCLDVRNKERNPEFSFGCY